MSGVELALKSCSLEGLGYQYRERKAAKSWARPYGLPVPHSPCRRGGPSREQFERASLSGPDATEHRRAAVEAEPRVFGRY